MTLDTFNALGELDAADAMSRCCTASRWIDLMVEGRPYRSGDDLVSRAEANWAGMAETDWLEAFEGHPKIGDPASLRKKYRATLSVASGEQSAVHEADAATLDELSRLNGEYLDRFGFIFITFASGRSASDILAELRQRIGNPRAKELEIAASEQWKITRLRLDKQLLRA